MQWEYLVKSEGDIELNELGLNGWELVAVTYEQWENQRKGYTESQNVFYLKRPINPAEEAEIQ